MGHRLFVLPIVKRLFMVFTFLTLVLLFYVDGCASCLIFRFHIYVSLASCSSEVSSSFQELSVLAARVFS